MENTYVVSKKKSNKIAYFGGDRIIRDFCFVVLPTIKTRRCRPFWVSGCYVFLQNFSVIDNVHSTSFTTFTGGRNGQRNPETNKINILVMSHSISHLSGIKQLKQEPKNILFFLILHLTANKYEKNKCSIVILTISRCNV